MRMKGAFLLGLTVCWTVLCNSAEGNHISDNGRSEENDVWDDSLTSSLEKEFLMKAGSETEIDDQVEVKCKKTEDCKEKEDCFETKCMACDCGEQGTCKIENGNKVCTCKDKHAEKNGVCDECDCGEQGTCKFENGNKVCTCKDKHAEKNGVCDACDCGEQGTCKFESGRKTCTCNAKHVENNGVCAACDCGEQGICKFESGKKLCTCNAKHAENNGVCAVCDCGDQGTCKFENGNKICTCNAKYAENNGVCAACNCGDKGTCTFVNNAKTCKCFAKHSEDGGICKECDCGSKGNCSFVDGNKDCKCEDTYVIKEKDGKCNKCDCGEGGRRCFFEEDNPECECHDDYRSYKGRCIECDCGINGDCELKDGKKDCTCHSSNFAVRTKGQNITCVETCQTEDDCQNKGNCNKFGDVKFCDCKRGVTGDRCETIIDCVTGKYKGCENSGGSCKFDGFKAVCSCSSEKELDIKRNICRSKCEGKEDYCKNGAKCVGKLCECLDGTSGDDCSSVDKCGELKCEDKDATCKYNSKTRTTTCVCNHGDFLFVKDKCVKKCIDNKDCKNGATCENNLCKCKPGTSGDDCGNIDECDTLKCDAVKAKCIYDVTKSKATCECIDENLIYVNKQCKAKWCQTNCKASISNCEWRDGTGVCTCLKPEEHYDYSDDSCKGIDKCLLEMKCKENEVCEDSKCNCKPNYVLKKEGEQETCQRKKFCDTKPCFDGANCTEGNVLGKVRCFCAAANSFYSPKTGKCEDGSCFLPNQKGNCKECPSVMEFKDGGCKPKGEAKACDKDCGPGGWCMNNAEGKPECLCHQKYSKKDGDICILKATEMCPDGQILKDNKNKCNCTDIYKYASNGVTCEKRSCLDDDVQKESKGAICSDNWKSKTVAFKFSCPNGYRFNSKDGCSDRCQERAAKSSCSDFGQMCYVGGSSDPECRCPPTFDLSVSGVKKTCDVSREFTYMLNELPVIRKNYNKQDNSIDKVKLYTDVIKSMKRTFKDLEFAHVFTYKLEKDVIFSNVWLQFSKDATSQIKRWTSQLVENNKTKEAKVLPPALLLSPGALDKVKDEVLKLCSTPVIQAVCGQGADCKDEVGCFCKDGFRTIDPTIKEIGKKSILRCEDINECEEGTHECTNNNTCVNILGGYFCKCKPGYKKKEGEADAMDKTACTGLCEPNPCIKGSCEVTKDHRVDCTCDPGHSGSLCNRPDVILQKAQHSTTIVGAVLGTFLAVIVVLIVVYVVRQRKSSYSEDFTPAPRLDNAEMSERRPMRGVTNRAFQ